MVQSSGTDQAFGQKMFLELAILCPTLLLETAYAQITQSGQIYVNKSCCSVQ